VILTSGRGSLLGLRFGFRDAFDGFQQMLRTSGL